MGEQSVAISVDEKYRQAFARAVLNDLHALEKMFRNGLLETGVRRIGAEQEIFLVDHAMRPAPLAVEVIEAARDSRLTTEIGRFNLEANLTPHLFEGACLSELERELNEILDIVRAAMAAFRGGAVMCGILPTIQNSDLVEANLTPGPRYAELNRILTALHGEDRVVHIKGLDEIKLRLSDTFIEFCNTSFQVHLQVPIDEFTEHYNWAQAVTAPVLAAAVNSPLLLGNRLWHETRLALFQHAVDERSPVQHERSRPARVTFGREWVDDSILEIFHEDVARFRIILTRDLEENSLDVLNEGRVPKLDAWRMHNGTVWRWNRPCYGITDGKPGLRIEARFLPSGPSAADEVANAALLLGLVTEMPKTHGDVRDVLSFDDAKSNFFGAARYGLKSQITWINGKTYSARDLILNELLPIAREGLRRAKVDDVDADRFLGIIQERVAKEITGARWMLDSLAGMDKSAKTSAKMRALTEEMKARQESGDPLHTWPLARIEDRSDWVNNYRTVEQFMSRDLFTVRPDDVLDLAASLMEWKHIRHVPVENDSGALVGIVTHRDLLHLLAEDKGRASGELIVSEVMKTDLITITPDTRTLDALYIMRERNIGCLPVVAAGKLVGLLTAHDFLVVSTRILEERLKLDDA
jgi:CBS domain-containing protein/gamma-glutamylcysteine synthetase